ncbi:MAG: nitronate monooxygenase [Pseudomonadota bacterium]
MDHPAITNDFTRRFGLTTPIALAPMALAGGGALAAECANAGALALVGGGYGDLDWTRREYQNAVGTLRSSPASLVRLGCGFITWRMEQDRSALDWLLDQGDEPSAIMLSFGDPRNIARAIVDRGIPLICQIQTIAQLPLAIEAGASVVVAQGAEAGGHGMNALDGRSTFTLVPEVADYLAKNSCEASLLAAGGISDGRGLAAAIVLGADGALIGSRLWAANESLAPSAAIERAIAANGDATARSGVFDILREKSWPSQFNFRALRNRLHREWENRITELRADPLSAIAEYQTGVQDGDFDRAHVTVGEGVGLIHNKSSAREIICEIDAKACELLGHY